MYEADNNTFITNDKFDKRPNSEPFFWKNSSNQQLQICLHQRKKH